jgi:formylglycine-generating enzyme required for sulfatase activity
MQVRLERDPQVFALGQALAQGGEASIHVIAHRPDLVAKVYRQPTPDHAAKLAAMIARPPRDPLAGRGHVSIAWPVDRLLAAGDRPGFLGYVMPRVNQARPILEFYNPKARLQLCPGFHYGYLLRTARNLAAAVQAVHECGYVIGDVNESNILVNNQALVTLVDTDSFQVVDRGRVYRCPVGKPEYSAPELQGTRFADFDRGPEQDNFALGVVIFQLLMQGIHPFAGRFIGRGEPAGLPERIAAGHWPYAQTRKVPYSPNPHAPGFETLPPPVQELLRACFEGGHTRSALRPDAFRWRQALEQSERELTTCPANAQHVYHRGLAVCPWCSLAQSRGSDPFAVGPPSDVGARPPSDVAAGQGSPSRAVAPASGSAPRPASSRAPGASEATTRTDPGPAAPAPATATPAPAGPAAQPVPTRPRRSGVWVVLGVVLGVAAGAGVTFWVINNRQTDAGNGGQGSDKGVAAKDGAVKDGPGEPDPERQKAEEATRQARQLLAKHDFAGALALLEGIPERLRDVPFQEEVRRQLDRVARLDKDIKGALAAGRLAGLRPAVAELAKLQPGREDLGRLLNTLPGDPVITNSIGMKLVWVPAGTFTMGSPAAEPDRDPSGDEPEHEVKITRWFYLGAHEVTQGQYEAVMRSNPSHFDRDNGGGPEHPVERVTWEEANAFCRRLSETPEEAREGHRYRLPTEAEWEYACRAGSRARDAYSFGPSLSSRQANIDNARGRTTKVGEYAPNAFGLYDMHGNVWEWCADWYESDFYRRGPFEDPKCIQEGKYRVRRGGSWSGLAQDGRSANRDRGLPTDRSDNVGFRVVLEWKGGNP